MDKSQLGGVVRYLHTMTVAGRAGTRSDHQLLDDFTARWDETAFAELVRRHGPLVLGVCRRVLNNSPDAEDAFQATFMVLVRRARAIKKQASVGSWLYAVAFRTAVRARRDLARRRTCERQAIPRTVADVVPEAVWRDLRPILDEEVSRLPAKYRAPVVLCYLDELTYEEAARHLGCPKGTVATRLARARELLRAKLTRRGVALSAGVAAVLMSEKMAPAVPPALCRTTVHGAALVAGNTPIALAISGTAAGLTQGVLEAMALSKMKVALGMALALGLAVTGIGLFAEHALMAKPAQSGFEQPLAAAKPEPPQKSESVDPAKAKDRLGSFARRVWTIIDLVLQNHLDPCPRQEMILAGAKALLQAAKTEPPADLDQRIAKLETPEQFTSWLREAWPKGEGAQALTPEQLETALLDGLFKRVPGEAGIISADTLKTFRQISGNRYVGTGLQLGYNKEEQCPVIINPFRKGVAWRAGARPGDLIVEVDGQSTRGVGLQKVVEWIRGEEGTAVTVVVKQPGAAEARTLHLKREVIPIDTVFGFRRVGAEGWQYRVDPAAGIGYVWINAVRSSTLHELRQIERRLRSEGARALILDLRFSGGDGALQPITLLADGLLDGGVMWRTRDAHRLVKEYRADRECVFRGWPLVVLVNEAIDQTHGALLAALQDNGRAVLVGEATKTDGYFNALLKLPDGEDAIRVRSFRIERAAPERGWPVVPDHPVAMSEAQRKALSSWLMSKALAELPAGTTDEPPEDPQLAKAVELLQATLKASNQSGK